MPRFKASFSCDVISLLYRELFVSLTKESLNKVNPEYTQKLYMYGDKKNKKSKNFCYSVYLKDFAIKDNEIHLENGLEWIVSSPDTELLSMLADGLNQITDFKYKEYTLKRKSISLLPEIQVEKDVAVFKTLSPIFIKNMDGKHIGPTDPGYEDAFNYICDMTLQNYRGTGLQQPLQFISIHLTKQIVKESFGDTSEIRHLETYKGTFMLKGKCEDMEILRQTGMSFKKSQGYGCVSVDYQ